VIDVWAIRPVARDSQRASQFTVEEHRSMNADTDPLPSPPVKLIAAIVVAACLIVGIAGLLLPLIPGVLFLAIAAVIAARHWPALDALLRRNTTIARYMDEANASATLPLGERVRLACLLLVKALIDGVALLVAGVTKLVRSAARA
jgi:uncharacterized membrane protein YbaN (DUF454 family)